MVNVDGPCPACKYNLGAHPPSAPCPRANPGPIDLVRGRCILAGVRAPQKLCWVLLSGVPTLDEYLSAYGSVSPPAPACPGCSGETARHGSFMRRLAIDPVWSTAVRLYRALCKNPGCPVVTVTLYPPFVTPYQAVPTPVRENLVREHQQGAVSWDALAAKSGFHRDTLRRWARAINARAGALRAAFVTLLDWAAPAHHDPQGVGPPSLWGVADDCARALALPVPRLAIARLTVPGRILVALPVWT